MLRFLITLIFGGAIGFGIALWFQGEPPFAGSPYSGSSDMVLTLSDAYLTSQSASAIESASSGHLSQVQITSAPGDIAYIRAQGAVNGVSAPVGASVRPEASDGAVVLNVKSVHVGPIPIPEVVVAPLSAVVNARTQALISGSPFVVVGAGTTSKGIEVFLDRRS